jgi:hypothetical protein
MHNDGMPSEARLALDRSTRGDTRPFQSKLTRTSFAFAGTLNGIHFVPAWYPARKTGVGRASGGGAISALISFFTIGRSRRRQIGSNMSISRKTMPNWTRYAGQSSVEHRSGAMNGGPKPHEF